MTNENTQTRSNWWYLLPILIGIIGGVIAYFVLRHDDKDKGKNCIIIGIVLSLFLHLIPIFGMIGILTINI